MIRIDLGFPRSRRVVSRARVRAALEVVVPAPKVRRVGHLGQRHKGRQRQAPSWCRRPIGVDAEGQYHGTLLGDAELEMLVILRMNRDFMQFMREHYPEVAKQHFSRTIVDLQEGDDEP